MSVLNEVNSNFDHPISGNKTIRTQIYICPYYLFYTQIIRSENNHPATFQSQRQSSRPYLPTEYSPLRSYLSQ